MARYRDSVCRLCRRENMKMFLKGDRCYSDKCAIDRRNYPPGQHGQGRSKHSEYAVQLREKQKVKWMYGLLENQFRGTFKHAERMKGMTGTNLLVLLERQTGQRDLPLRVQQFPKSSPPIGSTPAFPGQRSKDRYPFFPNPGGRYHYGQGKKPGDRFDPGIHGSGGPSRGSPVAGIG